ncbi:CPCC family cysteine-rich protein [Clostridium ganghwense]|uniref:CPCC family cysteine-rich protein n=1 Tax=Clostridium ganghwense TaxID=312089 RepID=UPI00300E12BF
MQKYTCPCCGYKTLDEKPPDTYQICPICFWEDDGYQIEFLGETGANHVSLRAAQENFKRFGACEERVLDCVRKPTEEDIFDGPLDISDVVDISLIELIKLFTALKLPLDKLIDLYCKNIMIPNSKLMFNPKELNEYLSEEDISEYYMLSSYHEIKDLFNYQENVSNEMKRIINLSEEQVQEKLETIRGRFCAAVKIKNEKLNA